jgi:hypothetical protein
MAVLDQPQLILAVAVVVVLAQWAVMQAVVPEEMAVMELRHLFLDHP